MSFGSCGKTPVTYDDSVSRHLLHHPFHLREPKVEGYWWVDVDAESVEVRETETERHHEDSEHGPRALGPEHVRLLRVPRVPAWARGAWARPTSPVSGRARRWRRGPERAPA